MINTNDLLFVVDEEILTTINFNIGTIQLLGYLARAYLNHIVDGLLSQSSFLISL